MAESQSQSDIEEADAAVDTPPVAGPSSVRTNMEPYLPTLLNYWEKGMQNNSDSESKRMIKEAALLTELPEEKIENWIRNHTAKLRRERKRAEGGEEPASKTKKQKITKRAPDAYRCFLKHHMAGKSGRQDLKAAGLEYTRIKNQEPELHQMFKKKAEESKKITIQDLDKASKQAHAMKKFASMAETITDIQACGWEGFVAFWDDDVKDIRSCGTKKVEDFMAMKTSQQFMSRFANAMASGSDNNIPRKENAKDLRKQVRGVMNAKWFSGATDGGKGFSYRMFKDGQVAVEGLPEGVPLRNPSSLGPKNLRAILNNKDNITVQVVEAQDDRSAGHQEAADNPTPGGSQNVDTVEGLLTGVEAGLQEAGQNSREVTLVPQNQPRVKKAVTSRKGTRRGRDKGKGVKRGKKNIPKCKRSKGKGRKKIVRESESDSDSDVPLAHYK